MQNKALKYMFEKFLKNLKQTIYRHALTFYTKSWQCEVPYKFISIYLNLNLFQFIYCKHAVNF